MRGSKERRTARERRRGEGGGSGACHDTEKSTTQQTANGKGGGVYTARGSGATKHENQRIQTYYTTLCLYASL